MAGYDPLADAPALAAWLQVSPVTIRSWAHRGLLHKRGRAGRRALYSVLEAAKIKNSDTADSEPA